MDEHLSGRLDDSGEGTLERPPRRHPAPPPRLDSYHVGRGPSSLNSRSGSGRSGSGSEIFDRLPDSGLHGDDGGSSEESDDVYSQLDSLDRHKRGEVRRQPGRGQGLRPRPGHPRQGRPAGKGGAPPPECSPPPPPRPKFGGGAGGRSMESPKMRPGQFPGQQSRGQSTFGKAATMYKAESLSLEAMRGGSMGNHSTFFQDQGKCSARHPSTLTALSFS